MQKKHPPTAISCGNDVIAAGALAMNETLNIRASADLSITGFEDLVLASNVVPTLTTIFFPTHELGAEAGHALLKRLLGEELQDRLELNIELRPRGSAAPPSSASRRGVGSRPRKSASRARI